MAKKKQYDILSPDGFSIHHINIYNSPEEAETAFKNWKKLYKLQGFYSTIRDGQRVQIPLKDLRKYCKLVEV